jgi:hypothetical protein
VIDFNPMRGPATQAAGSVGVVRIAGLYAGTLTAWRIVVSPTRTVAGPDGQPIPAYTLFGEGHLLGFFRASVGAAVTANLTPATPTARIGRPKPKPSRPFRLVGEVFELTPRRIVIAAGEIVPAGT